MSERLRGGLHHGRHQLHLERRVLQLLRRAAHPGAARIWVEHSYPGATRLRFFYPGYTRWAVSLAGAAAAGVARCCAARLCSQACGSPRGRVALLTMARGRARASAAFHATAHAGAAGRPAQARQHVPSSPSQVDPYSEQLRKGLLAGVMPQRTQEPAAGPAVTTNRSGARRAGHTQPRRSAQRRHGAGVGRGRSGAPVEGKAQPGLRVGLAPGAARDGHQPVAHQQHDRDQACAPPGAPPFCPQRPLLPSPRRGPACQPLVSSGRVLCALRRRRRRRQGADRTEPCRDH